MPQPVTYTARYVFPIDRPPIEGGAITIAGERILNVGRREHAAAEIDLGDVAIVPGLVNAHTHLEFSSLQSPLGSAGMPLPRWIREVRAFRERTVGQSSSAIERGLAESVASGVTALGEIVTQGWTPDLQPLADTLLLREVICLTEERMLACLEHARDHLALSSADSSGDLPPVRAGLSPHAPYSVHPELLADLVELACRYEAPLAMHLAESQEEIEFLKTSQGPFRELLKEIGVWRPHLFNVPTQPIEYLRLLAKAPRALVFHGNYLDATEREYLAQNSERMSVVFCPRTHAYFRHEPYPLDELLAAGVNVALGTDSRASNPDLSILAEMRHAASRNVGVSSQQLLSLATSAGAKALGVERSQGTLTPGKLANLAVIALPTTHAQDPHDLLVHDGHVTRTCWRGSWVYRDANLHK